MLLFISSPKFPPKTFHCGTLYADNMPPKHGEIPFSELHGFGIME
jgi:hypothetical protein